MLTATSSELYIVTGVDPGLVHTGVVSFIFNLRYQKFHVVTQVFDGVDASAIAKGIDTVIRANTHGYARDKYRAATFIEAYRPRSAYQTDARMGAAVNELKHALPYARTIDNTGVLKIVRQPLLRLLAAWDFSTKTHHQDLRSAARIAVYGMLKDHELNAVLTAYVIDELDGIAWFRI